MAGNSIGVTVLLKYRATPKGSRKETRRTIAGHCSAPSASSIMGKEWVGSQADWYLLGFSAGSHLSAAALTGYDKPHYKPLDAISTRRLSAFDFGVLIYPAYFPWSTRTKSKTFTRNWIERPAGVRIFMLRTTGCRRRGRVRFWQELRRNGVSAELQHLSKGGHGYWVETVRVPLVTSWLSCASLVHKHRHPKTEQYR